MSMESSTATSGLRARPARAAAAPRAIRRATWALAGIGLALRLGFALLPLSAHLILLEDDAWMVMAIARNVALGRGITADGVNVTTGFQPLYPLTLGTLPYLIAPNALDAGVTASLLICALLAALAMLPLWWLARRFGGELAGLLAVALYAVNPYLIRISVNGMETALGLLLLLLLFAAVDWIDWARPRGVLLLALLTALAVLARLDAALAFVAITLCLALSIGEWRTMAGRWWTVNERRPRQIGTSSNQAQPAFVLRPATFALRCWPVALYIGATLLLLAPYFLFNWMVSGSLTPSSGRALAYMQSYAGSFNLTNGLSAVFQNSAVWLDWLPSLWLKLLVALGGVAALMLTLRRRLLRALPLLLYLPLPALYYGYGLQQIRERYFVGFSAVLIILLAWLAADVIRRWPRAAGGVAAALAAIMALNSYEAWSFYQTMRRSPELTQPTSYQAALWIRDNLPHEALIGAKNSGIYQYYSGHTVLNIDGKLNDEIVPVMERRALLDYLRAKGVRYLVDREETMAGHISFYSAALSDAPTHRPPTAWERLVIYGKIALSRLGLGAPPALDRRDDVRLTRPFSDVAAIIQRFPRPNTAQNPVVVYELRASSVP
jgi:hypothetical protein